MERNQGVTNFKFESPRVLFNKSDEARSRNSDWNVFMPELVCQCAEAAKKEKFTHFAVRDLGVCLSSSTVSEYYNEVAICCCFFGTFYSTNSMNPLIKIDISALLCKRHTLSGENSSDNFEISYFSPTKISKLVAFLQLKFV